MVLVFVRFLMQRFFGPNKLDSVPKMEII